MNKEDCDFIDSLGGPSAVAKLCGISSQAVSQWKKKGIPKPWRKFFEERNSKSQGQQQTSEPHAEAA